MAPDQDTHTWAQRYCTDVTQASTDGCIEGAEGAQSGAGSTGVAFAGCFAGLPDAAGVLQSAAAEVKFALE